MGVSKILGTVLAVLFSLNIFSQQDLKWFFGYQGIGLTFDKNGGAPTVQQGETPLEIYESISSVSDCEGNLLFYTDGVKVMDAGHQVMTNGSGLNGPNETGNTTSGSSPNGVLIVSDPGDTSRYYIFTIGETISGGANGWNYHIVDMALPGNGTITNPRGEVISKNQVIPGTGATSEFMAATGNECGDSIWVVTHSQTGSDFWAVPLTTTGGLGSVVTSNSGIGLAGTDESRGSGDFSPNGTKLAVGFMMSGGAHVFDFDFSSGSISNNITVNGGGHYGCEFSFDGDKVYFTNFTGGTLYQYNLLNSTLTSLAASPGAVLGDLERAPDGKIYIGRWNSNSVLSVLDTPDGVDVASAGFVENGLNVGGLVNPGLPQMFLRDGKDLKKAKIGVPFNLTQVCDKGGSLNLNATPACGDWTSDGFYVDNNGVFDPSGLATPGSYNVYYSVGNCIIPDTVTFLVEDCCPPLQVRDSVLCEGSDAFHVGMLLDTGIGTWAMTSVPTGTGSPAIFVDSIFDASNYVKNSAYVTDGSYEITYTYWNAPLLECPDSAVSIIVVDSFPRDIFLGANSNLIQECGTEYTFTAKGGLEYNWAAPISQTTNPQLVNSNGTYILTVNSPGENCYSTDSIEIEFDQYPTAGIDVRDTIVCGAGEIKVGVNQAGLHYTWNGGGVADDDSLLISSAGRYIVDIKSGPNGFCPISDTVDATLAPPFEVVFDGIGEDTTLCSFTDSLIIKTRNVDGADFEWSMGQDFEGVDSSRLILGFSDKDVVSLLITDVFGCQGDTSVVLNEYCDIPDPFVPNVIVPDGNTNTTFIPINFPPGNEGLYETFYPKSDLVIYNRWGIEMFEGSGYPSWRGENKRGNPVSAGVYYWVLDIEDVNGKQRKLNGFVQVMR